MELQGLTLQVAMEVIRAAIALRHKKISFSKFKTIVKEFEEKYIVE